MQSDDAALGLLRDGYRWGPQTRDGRRAVPIRLLGRPAVLVGGAEGVRRFYDARLRRQGAVPAALRLVLFGPGAVHGLDDAPHHDRKQLFLSTITPERVGELSVLARGQWAAVTSRWSPGHPVDVYREAVGVLASSVLPWAGIDVPLPEALRRGEQLARVVAGFGRPGAPYARSSLDRVLLQRWVVGLVQEVRSGRRTARSGSALAVMSAAAGPDGTPLSALTAATEVLNVVRPTVAVAWLVADAAHALSEHPDWRERVVDGGETVAAAFAQEVRRYYPFTPVLAARAREDQDVLGEHLPEGGFVVLDVYGTDHDGQHWRDPETFDPRRFLDDEVDYDAFVPQGGGDVVTGHRCPGEPVSVAMLTEAVLALAAAPRLQSSSGELDLTHLPPVPPRSFVVESAPEPSLVTVRD